MTDTEDLSTVEPGTNILLEGIIWNETTKGVLILNVTWRGKSYCGTLIDSTKSTWAPPSFKEFNKSTTKSGSCSTSSSTSSYYQSQNAALKDPYSYFGTNFGPASSLDLNTVQLCADPTVRTLRNGKRRYINQFESDLISDIELDVCNATSGGQGSVTPTPGMDKEVKDGTESVKEKTGSEVDEKECQLSVSLPSSEVEVTGKSGKSKKNSKRSESVCSTSPVSE